METANQPPMGEPTLESVGRLRACSRTLGRFGVIFLEVGAGIGDTDTVLLGLDLVKASIVLSPSDKLSPVDNVDFVRLKQEALARDLTPPEMARLLDLEKRA